MSSSIANAVSQPDGPGTHSSELPTGVLQYWPSGQHTIPPRSVSHTSHAHLWLPIFWLLPPPGKGLHKGCCPTSPGQHLTSMHSQPFSVQAGTRGDVVHPGASSLVQGAHEASAIPGSIQVLPGVSGQQVGVPPIPPITQGVSEQHAPAIQLPVGQQPEPQGSSGAQVVAWHVPSVPLEPSDSQMLPSQQQSDSPGMQSVWHTPVSSMHSGSSQQKSSMQQTYFAKHSSAGVDPHVGDSCLAGNHGSRHFFSLYLHFLTHDSGGASAAHLAIFDRPSASSSVSPVMVVGVSVRGAD